MKKCPNCFAEVPDYTVYCPRCYKKITGPAETAPKPAAAKPAAPAAAPRVANEKPEPPKAAPAAKKCPNCCKEVPDGAAFCPHCGTRLMNEAQKKAPSTQQTTQQTAQQNENPEKWIQEALDQAEIWQEAGVDKEEMRWYTTAVERAELAWKRSQTLENKRKLTRVYEQAGSAFFYRDPLYTEKMCRKMLALWRDDPGAEAAEWNAHAYTLQATAVLGHTDPYSEQEKGYARSVCNAAFDAEKQCGPENLTVKLGVTQLVVVAAEKCLDWNEPQTAQGLLNSIPIDEIQKDFEKAKSAECHGELDKDVYLQIVQLAIMRLVIDIFRVQAAIGPKSGRELDDMDEKLLRSAFEHAEQFVQTGIPWESVQAGAALAAALELQSEKGKRKWKECLKVTEETLDWIRQEKKLRIVADVKKTQAELLRTKSRCLCELKKYDEAIVAAQEEEKIAMERYETAPDLSAGTQVLFGYDREQAAWTYKAQTTFLGGKRQEAFEQQKMVCEKAIEFTQNLRKEYGDSDVLRMMIQHFKKAVR